MGGYQAGIEGEMNRNLRGCDEGLMSMPHAHAQGCHVTDTTLTAGRFAEGDFRVGHALGQAWSVLSQNFLSFFAVTAVAAMPQAATGALGDPINFLWCRAWARSCGWRASALCWVMCSAP